MFFYPAALRTTIKGKRNIHVAVISIFLNSKVFSCTHVHWTCIQNRHNRWLRWCGGMWILSTSVQETLRQLLNVQRCVRHVLNQCDYLLCEKWKIIDCSLYSVYTNVYICRTKISSIYVWWVLVFPSIDHSSLVMRKTFEI